MAARPVLALGLGLAIAGIYRCDQEARPAAPGIQGRSLP